MRSKLTSILLLLTLLLAVDTAHAQGLSIGDPAPKLGIEQFMQAPNGGKTLEELRGNAVVLEFWATWCAPCIAQIPHLNKLADEFKAQPIQFISITDENADVVSRFLEKREMKSWIGLDLDRSAFDAYGVYGLPKTILINPEGSIAAITHAEDVTAESIAALIEGRNLTEDAPESSTETASEEEPPKEEPLYEVVIRPARSDDSFGLSFNPMRGRVKATLITLEQALSFAHGLSPARITGPDSLLNRQLDLVVRLPEEQAEEFKSVFQKSLETVLGFSTSRETIEADVSVLTAPNGVTAGLHPAMTESFHLSTAPGIMAATYNEIESLRRNLEDVLERPVFDETGLTGRYDWDLEYDAEQPESVIDAVREQLGLEMKAEQREVDFLVIEKVEDTDSE